MAVSFNLEEDARFETSLESLHKSQAVKVIDTLQQIQQAAFSWDDFARNFKWQALTITGSDTYPSANALYGFQIIIDDIGTQMEVIGYTYNEQVIVCSIARSA